jgi:hypothetical protein
MTPVLAILLGIIVVIIISVIAKVIISSEIFNKARMYFRRQHRLIIGDLHLYEWPKNIAYFVAYLVLCFFLFFIFGAKSETDRTLIAAIPFFLYIIVSEFAKKH